jgi:hypothetical protein
VENCQKYANYGKLWVAERMPNLAFAVDSHPQHDDIIADILAGKPLQKIAAKLTPKLSVMALSRYRAHLRQHNQQLEASRVNSDTCVSKGWVEAQYVSLYNRAALGDRAPKGKRVDLPTARASLDSIARLNGYDAPRRTESVSLNLHAIGSGQLAQQLQAALHALPEAERRALRQAEPAIEAECSDPDETSQT